MADDTKARAVAALAIDARMGMALVALSAIGFGALGPLAHVAYAHGTDVPTLLMLRFGLGGAVLLALALARRERLPRGRALAALVALGAVGYVGESLTYFNALRHASAGLVALLLYVYLALVTLATAVLERRLPTLVQAVAVTFALVGTALTANPGGGSAVGVALGLGSAFLYTLYVIVSARVMQGVGALPAAAIISLAAAGVYGGWVVARGPAWPSGSAGWAAIMAMAGVSTSMAVAFFLAGLARVGPVTASMLSTLEPVVAVLLAAFFLGERLTLLQLVGGGIIVGAGLSLVRAEAAVG